MIKGEPYSNDPLYIHFGIDDEEDNKREYKKILGNLELLDLSQNKFIFHDDSNKIKIFGTTIILKDNNIQILEFEKKLNW